MDKIRIAVVGYGNIGKFAVQAAQAAPDMELAGVIRRDASKKAGETGVPVVADARELGKLDAAVLCTPTRAVAEYAELYLQMGINTADSFDIHGSIPDLKRRLDKTARENNAVSIISAGWDPGSDSVVRTLLEACAPKGLTYTNFGPGMSMGHSVAAKSIDGVADAVSMTIPLGASVHRRMVYVQAETGADFNEIAAKIKEDPYFSHDETHVIQVADTENVKDVGSGVQMSRKGVSGETHNQIFEFSMRINNPALTAQILIAAARASVRQRPGAYTLIEIPPVDLLYGDREELIRRLV